MKDTGTGAGVFWFTVVTVFFSFCLIGLGGLVTSKEVGLAVPDWPTSLDKHMFLLPLDKWAGEWGVFEEHSHRLLASIVGLLTAGLTSWFWIREARGITRIIALVGTVIPLGLLGVRTERMFIIMAIAAVLMIVFSVYKILKNRNAMRWWATMAYSMVIVQGVLGGYRVLLAWKYGHPDLANHIGIYHGTLAQVFLVVLALVALFSSNWWQKSRIASKPDELVPRAVSAHFLYATILVLLQLVIGATMRHQHNGLAIWDFPKAHGQWWPSIDASSMEKYNDKRSKLQEELYDQQRVINSKGQVSKQKMKEMAQSLREAAEQLNNVAKKAGKAAKEADNTPEERKAALEAQQTSEKASQQAEQMAQQAGDQESPKAEQNAKTDKAKRLAQEAKVMAEQQIPLIEVDAKKSKADAEEELKTAKEKLQQVAQQGMQAAQEEGQVKIFLKPYDKKIKPNHVVLHMAHRLIAVLILGLVFGTVMLARKKLGGRHLLTKLAFFWLGLVLVQILLGALTVLKYKPADIATMHVLFGSLTLIMGVLGAVICRNLHLPSLNKNSNVRDVTKIEQGEALD
jgi:heme A synthase